MGSPSDSLGRRPENRPPLRPAFDRSSQCEWLKRLSPISSEPRSGIPPCVADGDELIFHSLGRFHRTLLSLGLGSRAQQGKEFRGSTLAVSRGFHSLLGQVRRG